jgi:hypothetical protein
MRAMRILVLAFTVLVACATTGDAKPTKVGKAKQGQSCEGGCARGLTCIKYHGIAGARGPELSSCELRCSGKALKCPKGQACTTIADGPGQVCRPDESKSAEGQPGGAGAGEGKSGDAAGKSGSGSGDAPKEVVTPPKPISDTKPATDYKH